MFHRRTAWFSNSVAETLQKYWISEGGHMVGWRTAEYLFSEDATSPDTLRVFESSDYQRRNVTVFHSLFLRACERRRSSGSVCLGHYVLPPVCVQDVRGHILSPEVRNVVGRLIWELEDEQPPPQGRSRKRLVTEESRYSRDQQLDPETPQHDATVGREGQAVPVNNTTTTTTGLISMERLPRYCGELCDLAPDLAGCSACH